MCWSTSNTSSTLTDLFGRPVVPKCSRNGSSSIAGSMRVLIQWAQVFVSRLRLAAGMMCCASNIEAWPSVFRNIASRLPAVVFLGDYGTTGA